RARPWLQGILAVLAATDLAYHFPPLFSMLALLASRPELADVELTSQVNRSLMLDPQIMAMVLHVWLAATAVTGASVMLLVAGRLPTVAQAPPAAALANSIAAAPAGSAPDAAAQGIARMAAGWALGATVLQLPVGVWVLLTLPDRGQSALLGSDMVATLLFVASLAAVLGLLHHLAAVALGDALRGQVRRAAGLMLAVVLLMTAALDRTRHRTDDLATASGPPRLRVNIDLGPPVISIDRRAASAASGFADGR
ncbi:MAG TPA: hypothetical protein VG433_08600, partial [Pirellulales bacterium]|nr:hypothetical protein [Pirellulales bacterium]